MLPALVAGLEIVNWYKLYDAVATGLGPDAGQVLEPLTNSPLNVADDSSKSRAMASFMPVL